MLAAADPQHRLAHEFEGGERSDDGATAEAEALKAQEQAQACVDKRRGKLFVADEHQERVVVVRRRESVLQVGEEFLW